MESEDEKWKIIEKSRKNKDENKIILTSRLAKQYQLKKNFD